MNVCGNNNRKKTLHNGLTFRVVDNHILVTMTTKNERLLTFDDQICNKKNEFHFFMRKNEIQINNNDSLDCMMDSHKQNGISNKT